MKFANLKFSLLPIFFLLLFFLLFISVFSLPYFLHFFPFSSSSSSTHNPQHFLPVVRIFFYFLLFFHFFLRSCAECSSSYSRVDDVAGRSWSLPSSFLLFLDETKVWDGEKAMARDEKKIYFPTFTFSYLFAFITNRSALVTFLNEEGPPLEEVFFSLSFRGTILRSNFGLLAY